MDATSDNNGTVFCTNCGYKLGPEDRFCPECGTARTIPPTQPGMPLTTPPPGFPPTPSAPPFQSSLSSSAGYSSAQAADWAAQPTRAGNENTAADNKPELQFDVEYPEHSSRLLALIRLALLIGGFVVSEDNGFSSSLGSLLILPHVIVLTFLGTALFFTTVFSWFAILILGRYPRSLWNYALWVLRWSTNVEVFSAGLRDRYPPFSGSAEYPLQLNLAYPVRLSRLLIFVKLLLMIPTWIVLIFVTIAAYFAIVIGWIAVILIGRFPAGLHGFVTGWIRWSVRASVYPMLLTDAYPPFRMSP